MNGVSFPSLQRQISEGSRMPDRKELQIVDAETSRVYVFHLSNAEYIRAVNDLQYSTQLLCNAKALEVEDRSSSIAGQNVTLQKNDATEENEATEWNEAAEESEATAEECTGDAHNDGFRWVDGAVRLLLAEFKNRESLLNSGKISVKKFWESISTIMGKEGYQITGPQCKSKFHGLKKTYKSVKDHNGKSGNNRRSWPYLEVMDEMFGHKPWVSPTHTLDSTMMSPPSPACSSNGTSGSPAPSEGPSKRQKVSHESALEKLIGNVEESRQDRKKMHEDAMARQDRLLALLEKIAEK